MANTQPPQFSPLSPSSPEGHLPHATAIGQPSQGHLAGPPPGGTFVPATGVQHAAPTGPAFTTQLAPAAAPPPGSAYPPASPGDTPVGAPLIPAAARPVPPASPPPFRPSRNPIVRLILCSPSPR